MTKQYPTQAELVAHIEKQRKKAEHEAMMAAKSPEEKYTAPPGQPPSITAIIVDGICHGWSQAEVNNRCAVENERLDALRVKE